MKIAILCAFILSAAVAGAETIIIEYPDHYYAESTDTPKAKPAPSRESSALPLPAMATPVADHDSSAFPATARPVTNFDSTPSPADPGERRASMDKEVQRLQRERGDLMTPQEGETPEQAARRQQRAQGILRKINKMSSELLRMP
jgi:hypothetical protein